MILRKSSAVITVVRGKYEAIEVQPSNMPPLRRKITGLCK
jgi:hypothetical protein